MRVKHAVVEHSLVGVIIYRGHREWYMEREREREKERDREINASMMRSTPSAAEYAAGLEIAARKLTLGKV